MVIHVKSTAKQLCNSSSGNFSRSASSSSFSAHQSYKHTEVYNNTQVTVASIKTSFIKLNKPHNVQSPDKMHHKKCVTMFESIVYTFCTTGNQNEYCKEVTKYKISLLTVLPHYSVKVNKTAYYREINSLGWYNNTK